MLIILKDKILSARHIDDVTSAELPDRLADPELLELVLQHMLHIRCDEDDSVSCRRDDHGRVCACKRFFPKEACTTTMIVSAQWVPQIPSTLPAHCNPAGWENRLGQLGCATQSLPFAQVPSSLQCRNMRTLQVVQICIQVRFQGSR
jgi:hypothetical protein